MSLTAPQGEQGEHVRALVLQVVAMKKEYSFIALACLMYAVAWFVPVIEDGVVLPDGLPGWQAFRVAASAIKFGRDVDFNSWYGQLLCAISAMSTVVFPILLALGVWFRRCSVHRACGWVAVIGFVLNTHWFVFDGFGRTLRIGYYLWWWSFLTLAVGFFVLARRERALPVTINSAAA